jgi:hypothetical protein
MADAIALEQAAYENATTHVSLRWLGAQGALPTMRLKKI